MTADEFEHPDVVLCPDGPLLIRGATSIQDVDGVVHDVRASGGGSVPVRQVEPAAVVRRHPQGDPARSPGLRRRSIRTSTPRSSWRTSTTSRLPVRTGSSARARPPGLRPSCRSAAPPASRWASMTRRHARATSIPSPRRRWRLVGSSGYGRSRPRYPGWVGDDKREAFAWSSAPSSRQRGPRRVRDPGRLRVGPGEVAGHLVGVHADQAPGRVEHGQQTDLPGTRAQLQHGPFRDMLQQVGSPQRLCRCPPSRAQDLLIEGDLEAAKGELVNHAVPYPLNQ